MIAPLRAARSKATRLLALLLTIALGMPLPSAAGNDPDGHRVPWSKIEWEARKFLVDLEVQVSVDSMPVVKVGLAQIRPAQGEVLMPTEPELLAVRLVSRVLWMHSDVTAFVDPHTLSTVQSRELETGDNHRLTTLRYGTHGVLRARRALRPGDEDLPPERWTPRPDVWKPFDPKTAADMVVSDPAALFYAVAASELDAPGEAMELAVFSNDSLWPLRAKVGERARKRVTYERISARGKERVNENRPLLRVMVETDAPRNAEGEEPVISGFRPPIEMWLDPRERIPFEITAVVWGVGEVTLRVKEVIIAR